MIGEKKASLFGDYTPLDKKKRTDLLTEEEGKEVDTIEASKRRSLLLRRTIFPGIMLLSYLGLIVYFKRRGGYRSVEI